MDTQKKLFAFKLAEKHTSAENNGKWKIRDGIASAQHCTGATPRLPVSITSDSTVIC